MKRSFIKYFVIAVGLVSALILYFIYSARKQYRQHQVDKASQEMNMDLNHEDVKDIDEAWEKIDDAFEKMQIDTTEKK